VSSETNSMLDGLDHALQDWLATRVLPGEHTPLGAVHVSGITRPAAGQSNDTVLFDVTADPPWNNAEPLALVLRRQAKSAAIFQEPDVLREAAVIAGLAGTPVPVPAVLWTEADPGALGAPFFIMNRVPGFVPVGKPSIHLVGVLPTLTAVQRRRLWDSAMDAVVAIHGVPWRRAHGFLARGDVTDPANQLRAMIDFYRWTAAGRGFPITDAAVARLETMAVDLRPTEPVLVWGDARVGNIMFGESQQVNAVLDWELATIGPPELDLARWIFFDKFGTTAAGVDRLDGWPDLNETIATYEQRSGRRVSNLGFYELMDELFMATTLIRQADLWVDRGFAEPDSTMGHANTATQMIARRLGMDVPELSPDYIAHRAPGAKKAIHTLK
jgi:aminoglycoside phosphotransferase (APT) family kinase protein